MGKLKQFWEICRREHSIGAFICLLASVFLLIASFWVPPTGEISASVLRGVAELLAFFVIFRLPEIISSIEAGRSLKFSAGGVDVTIANDNKEDEDNKEKEA